MLHPTSLFFRKAVLITETSVVNAFLCVCVCLCMCVCVCVYVLSRVLLIVTPWTAALQAPLSMELPRQEYWTGLPVPSPGNLPNPGIQSARLMSPELAGGFLIPSTTWEAIVPGLFNFNLDF